jgi:uncharacterized protein (TIGR00730 family)
MRTGAAILEALAPLEVHESGRRMNNPKELLARNFPTADQDARQATKPSLYAGPDSSYDLAFADPEFLLHPELRPVRMQLELLKPELIQREENIQSTIVMFGSARILPMDDAQAALAQAQALPAGHERDQTVRKATRQVEMACYYEEARAFAGMVTRHSAKLETPIYVVTGGGPGVMEAGNRGAYEVGGKSIGLNIVLPHEQEPNPYITPKLCFQFHYFALRKMHFLMRSVALLCFPGGFGTLDELFEALTLMQTGKCRKRPVLLFGREFWTKLINMDHLVETGMISPGDVSLFRYVETAQEAWDVLRNEYGLGKPEDSTCGW